MSKVDITMRIVEQRHGAVAVGIKPVICDNAAAAARLFDLADAVEAFREITHVEAEEVLTNVMHKDMAYSSEIMPRGVAQLLAREFLETVGRWGARYYTNGDWSHAHKTTNGIGWTPVTTATFDTGVLIVTPRSTACAWFADED